jgi:hypothetical protein
MTGDLGNVGGKEEGNSRLDGRTLVKLSKEFNI